jgi:hypothetical protein
MSPPELCPECDIPINGGSCRHCGFEQPETNESPKVWLDKMRDAVARSKPQGTRRGPPR